jgi:hypothetical protein
MAVLGIITCEILEREFAHLLAHDPQIQAITILENQFSQHLIEAVTQQTKLKPQLIASLAEYTPPAVAGLEIIVRVMKVGLHSIIKNLRNGVLQAVAEMAPYVDAILLGYGLCGNALRDSEELFLDSRVPVFLPMDGDHPVDDCIGLIIGGRENYYAEQCKVAGTMFINSGFLRHWEKLFHEGQYAQKYVAIMKRLMANYKRSLLLPTPVASEQELASGIEKFNEIYGLRTEVRPGTLDLLEQAWNSAKQSVHGNCLTNSVGFGRPTLASGRDQGRPT